MWLWSVWYVFVLFSLQFFLFFLSIPDKICSSPRTMCVFDFSLFWISPPIQLTSFLVFSLLIFRFSYASRVCNVWVYLGVFQYILLLQMPSHRASIVLGDIIIFFSQQPLHPSLLSSTYFLSLSLSFPFLACVCVLLSFMLQLCFATMWCIFSIRIICMNSKAPFMFHW